MEVGNKNQKQTTRCHTHFKYRLLFLILFISIILNVFGIILYSKLKGLQNSFYINIKMKTNEIIDNSYDIVDMDEINSNYTCELGFVKTCAGLIQVFANDTKAKITFIEPTGFNIVEHIINKSNDFGIILMDKTQRLWIIFRGTQTFNDILNDVQYSQISYGGINVHNGFHKLFLSISEQIFKTIDAYKPKRIIVTGHSLGAAIATLTTNELHRRYPHIQLKGVGFASPRVGDHGFAKLFKSIDWTNIINIEDIVTQLPRAVINASNGIEIYQHVGNIRTFSINKGSILLNHLIPAYRASLHMY